MDTDLVYQFDQQLKKGKDGERELDEYLSRWFRIKQVDTEEERRLGIDRRFVSIDHNWPFTVEYKTDARAHSSGNAFIETLSSVQDASPGWARKSRADIIAHYIPESREIRFLDSILLRSFVLSWMWEYPWKDVPNVGYMTRGICVPLRVLDKTVVVGRSLAKQQNFAWAQA